MNLNLRLKEIDARLAEIRNASNAETNVETLNNYETECDKLQEERKSIQAKLSIQSKTEVKPLVVETKSKDNATLEKRGIDLKEKRTIVVSSDEILLPNHVDTNIASVPYNEVSTLVDKVKVVNLVGGETYTKAFVKSSGDAKDTFVLTFSYFWTSVPSIFLTTVPVIVGIIWFEVPL